MVLALRKEVSVSQPEIVDGLYSGAQYKPAFKGRVGGVIVPKAAVIHTTDMMPNSFDALVKAWTSELGVGACATGLIGRTPEQGFVQFIKTTNNANHAGGTNHGWYTSAAGQLYHPNMMTVGIELHGAGRLEWLSKDRAVFQEEHKTLGEFSVAAGEVFIDQLGRPWHTITQYQLDTLEQFLVALKPSLGPTDLVPKANAAYVKNRTKWDTSYAVPTRNTLIGHVSLDVINRSDPGPQVMKFINDFAERNNWK